jgi:hypothetical protein
MFQFVHVTMVTLEILSSDVIQRQLKKMNQLFSIHAIHLLVVQIPCVIMVNVAVSQITLATLMKAADLNVY